MQGVEGTLIRYLESYDPLNEDHRLQGAKWRVDPSLGEHNRFLSDLYARLTARSLPTVPGRTPTTISDILHLGRSLDGVADDRGLWDGQPCPVRRHKGHAKSGLTMRELSDPARNTVF